MLQIFLKLFVSMISFEPACITKNKSLDVSIKSEPTDLKIDPKIEALVNFAIHKPHKLCRLSLLVQKPNIRCFIGHSIPNSRLRSFPSVSLISLSFIIIVIGLFFFFCSFQ